MANDIEEVLQHLKRTRAFDFTGYRRATLTRRIDKRMHDVGIDGYDAYVDYIEVHPDELGALLDTVLINVSAFFRDTRAWASLRSHIVNDLLPARPSGPLRVWSAGCATGREAYSMVMLLAEELGVDAVKSRLKVYATDLDEDALEHARRAVYTDREMEGVPPDLVAKYFEAVPHGHAFNGDLRRLVIFGRHDLLQDAPISRVDVLLCRNTLMYFNTDVQHDLLERLHFSLADDGLIMLGKAEMLLGQSDLFVPVDMKERIFRKVPRTTMRSRLLTMSGALRLPAGGESDQSTALEVAFDRRSTAEVLLDPAGTVIAVNGAARALFAITVEVLGRPFQDLELSYRPVELRSYIDQAQAEGRSVRLDEVERHVPTGDPTFLDIEVTPLITEPGPGLLGFLLTFTDVTTRHLVNDELEQAHRDTETAYEELQSSNEELETTNEELQSTIEELETTNEELQSTNEELETMNEELSSTNEELHAINEELSDRSAEVGRVNAYMESILTSLQASVIVVDSQLAVQVWNGLSYELWGLRPEEVEGTAFLSLDIGYPVEVLGPPIRACLLGGDAGGALTVDATTRRGHTITCRTRVSPLLGANGQRDGAIVVIEPVAGTGRDVVATNS
jgi:two-component system, chemotaxis family, CheB/CheR fusion protein